MKEIFPTCKPGLRRLKLLAGTNFTDVPVLLIK